MKQHKQFRIGEYAMGGIIEVTINDNEIELSCHDWDTKEKIVGKVFDANGVDSDYAIIETLNDYTSNYYADEIFTWIKKYVAFPQSW